MFLNFKKILEDNISQPHNGVLPVLEVFNSFMFDHIYRRFINIFTLYISIVGASSSWPYGRRQFNSFTTGNITECDGLIEKLLQKTVYVWYRGNNSTFCRNSEIATTVIQLSVCDSL